MATMRLVVLSAALYSALGFSVGPGRIGHQHVSRMYAKPIKADHSEMFMEWYHTAISSLNATEPLTPIDIDGDYKSVTAQIGVSNDANTIVFSSEAFKSKSAVIPRMN